MSHKKRKRRGQTGANQENGQGGQENSTLQYSPPVATCQLSPDSLTRIAYIAGDLAMFYLIRCKSFINLPDPEFNKPFFKACELLDIEDTLLRRAAEAVLMEASR